jgi:PIN domain nuclease of toxin-antitoxin system
LKILIDTHIFLWAITEDGRLSEPHRAIYQDEASDLHMSIASIWEMLIKTGLGKLALPAPATEYIAKQMDQNRIATLGIRVPHLAELERLPPLHCDPFDRMLVSQARVEGMPILSADPALRKYDVAVL